MADQPIQPRHFTLNATDPEIQAGDPDCLVVMGRELARSMINHPEPYTRVVCGQEVLVVDEESYDILFYLFSRMTRTQLYKAHGTIGVLNLQAGNKVYIILTEKLYTEAARLGMTS